MATTIDAFGRSNGPVDADAGALIWRDTGWDGNAGDLVIVDGQLAPATSDGRQATVTELGADFDFAFDLPTKPGGGVTVVAAISDIGSGWQGLFLTIDSPTANWSIFQRVSGSVTELASSTFVGGSVGAAGHQVRFRRVGSTLAAYFTDSGALTAWQLVTTGDTEDQAVAGPIGLILDNNGTRVDNLVDLLDTPSLTFSRRWSGGASNTDPALSIGGSESSENYDQSSLFPAIGYQDAAAGKTIYRGLYVHNDDDTDADAVAWLSTQLSGDLEIAVGAADEDAGETMEALDDEETAPSGVSFSAPADEGSAVALGSIPAGDGKGLWLRLTVPVDTPADPTNPWVVSVGVTPL